MAMAKIEGPKINLPDTFNRTRSKLKAFLTQLELYIGFHVGKFNGETEKVL